MGDDIQTNLALGDCLVSNKSDTWIDLKCSHFAPVNGNVEAFDFRVSSTEHKQYKAEIHWDNGKRDVICHSMERSNAIDLIRGYFGTAYDDAIARHARATEMVNTRNHNLFQSVNLLCAQFPTIVAIAVAAIELDNMLHLSELDIIDIIDIGGEICVMEMTSIRRNMDIVFTKAASGQKWSDVKFKSPHGIDITLTLSDLIEAVKVCSEETQNIAMMWTLNELKLKFRESMQSSYQLHFA